MNIFFKTFLKVFASLLTIVVFFAVLLGFLSFIGSNKTNSQFTFIKGIQSSDNKIAILKLQGPIVSDSININNIVYFQIINPEKIRKKIENLKVLKPKILIISINSPGGSVSASYNLYNLFKDFKVIPYLINPSLISFAVLTALFPSPWTQIESISHGICFPE